MIDKNDSRELYLRTIYELSRELRRVRNVDIAKELGYSKPSVTNALKKLYVDGMVSSDKENGIQLTAQGIAYVEKSTERQLVLEEFLLKLGLNEECAIENAQRIGNRITDELFQLICNECRNHHAENKKQ